MIMHPIPSEFFTDEENILFFLYSIYDSDNLLRYVLGVQKALFFFFLRFLLAEGEAKNLTCIF